MSLSARGSDACRLTPSGSASNRNSFSGELRAPPNSTSLRSHGRAERSAFPPAIRVSRRRAGGMSLAVSRWLPVSLSDGWGNVSRCLSLYPLFHLYVCGRGGPTCPKARPRRADLSERAAALSEYAAGPGLCAFALTCFIAAIIVVNKLF